MGVRLSTPLASATPHGPFFLIDSNLLKEHWGPRRVGTPRASTSGEVLPPVPYRGGSGSEPMKKLLVLWGILMLIGGGCLVLLGLDDDPGDALVGALDQRPAAAAPAHASARRGSHPGAAGQAELWQVVRQQQP